MPTPSNARCSYCGGALTEMRIGKRIYRYCPNCQPAYPKVMARGWGRAGSG